jgi:hypothetical protein
MNAKEACTARVSEWNYDMEKAPVGQLCFLLSIGRVAVKSIMPKENGDGFWIAWAPMPRRDKDEERRRGLL